MGTGYACECSECGYCETFFIGVGFGFPEVYRKLFIKAKNGEFGEELKKLIKVYPQGKIDAETVLAVCNECGNIEAVIDLSMYVPKKGYVNRNVNRVWSVAYPFKGINYATYWDLINHYELIESYQHKCKKCHGNMKIVFREGQKEINLKCPECCAALKLSEIFCWD